MKSEKGVSPAWRWAALSIRARLSMSYAAALGMMLVIYAAFVYTTVRERFGVEIDHRLDQEVEIAEQALVRDATGQLSWRMPGERVDGYVTLANMLWVDVHLTDGTLVYRLTGGYAKNRNPEALPFGRRAPGFFSTRLSSGVSLRVLQREVEVDGIRAVIRAAFPEEQIERELASLLWVLAVGLPLAIGAAGIAGYWLAGRALAPVSKMTDEAQSITADRLHARLPIANPNDELGRLGTTFNDLFARLEGSFEQLRRFTSDASHELRTPLTVIRSVGEVALRERHDEAGYREIIGAMLEESDRLAQLVQSLLTLARADGGRIPLNPAPFDLAELGEETASHLQILAEEKSQQLLFDNRAGQLPVMGDRSVMRQAVLNVLDNAIKYSPEKGPIRVVARCDNGRAILEIEDSGPGIALEHRAKVFDRFYRIDSGRSRKEGGFGLGLAIARWAVEANGGRIVVQRGDPGGSVFRMTLPLSKQAD
ncbi:ATP-binding protein [Azoarcus sp. DN11]|uniref:sensor histidine kinase n=1 Tax=Azoarcus sp. DN11 TaxID=356837 RepID=UPI0013E40A21|nr:ATP-binding protein [Azoarcus sp. DN11]